MSPKKQRTAARLGLWLGGFGAHNFYIGKTRRGLAQLLLGLIDFAVLVVGIFFALPAVIVAATTFGVVTLAVWVWGISEGSRIGKAQPGTKWRLDAKGLDLA
ncbi:MAG: TM2 domain-containing protein [Cellulomonadaceae bacterium]|jgi:TM2 domain-containing membrane protein YozV|nr:TM2 domain-containing protein [Cellulomonadaceae bacterium]